MSDFRDNLDFSVEHICGNCFNSPKRGSSRNPGFCPNAKDTDETCKRFYPPLKIEFQAQGIIAMDMLMNDLRRAQ